MYNIIEIWPIRSQNVILWLDRFYYNCNTHMYKTIFFMAIVLRTLDIYIWQSKSLTTERCKLKNLPIFNKVQKDRGMEKFMPYPSF
jgi:hypothetical protein